MPTVCWCLALAMLATFGGCALSHERETLDDAALREGRMDAAPSDGGLDAAVPDAGTDAAATDVGADACLDPVSNPACCDYGTTTCMTDADCRDPTPFCVPLFALGQRCATSRICGAMCASPDTMIATPSGERAIADLRVGDLVYSQDASSLVVVPLLEVVRTPVFAHHVVRVALASGRVLEISPGHPTADGRSFADLHAGDRLDGVLVTGAELVPYFYEFTYDVLPASDTGTYAAGGVLIGSTLAD